ncbi:hypothetical protein HDU93_004810, partial [Gonapodya sp. JEL0774]
MSADRHREKHLAILDAVRKNATRGDAGSVLKVMDELGWSNHWHMSLGDKKAEVVRGVIREYKPRTLLELGSYLGYSATVMGSEMVKVWKESGGG